MSNLQSMVNDCKKIYLCSPDLKIYGILNGIRTDSVELAMYAKDFWELSFEVDKYLFINGEKIESNNYEDIRVLMYLYLEDIGYFKLEEPTIINDGNSEWKEVIAYSCDKEFEERDWLNLKINTGDAESLEQLAENNLDDAGFAKEFVSFYNTRNTELSFMHIMLQKMNGWTIGHIDMELQHHIIPRIDVNNANLYSILTTRIAPKLDMLFVFDILNRTINAYEKNNIDYDTTIFIGFRNLANEVNINVNEDSVFTRIKVRGDDELDFRNYNFGSDQVWDLSYFKTEPWMNSTLADKITAWENYRDSRREEFLDLEIESATITENLYELRYRVPSDETYWKQWSMADERMLDENLALYQSKLQYLQVSVDPRPDSERFSNYTDIQNRVYQPYTTSSGEVDHERYLDLLKYGGYNGYYTYKEIITYVIPYIETAIANRNLPSDRKTKYGEDSKTNWDLYGVVELEAMRASYEDDQLPALRNFSKAWDDLTEEEQLQYVSEIGYNTMGRNKYVEIQGYLGNENTPGTIYYKLKELNEEISELEAEQASLNSQMNTIKAQVDISRSGMSWSFTDQELRTINGLFVDTDYTNTNILSTSIDTTVSKLSKQKELYDDAVDKISELAQPQFDFEVELDNFLRIPEFQEWSGDLKLLRYVRLGIRDDYSVKLRIVSIKYNPCEVDENLSIKFSSMITSKSGRNDFTELIDDENNRAAKNSITLGTGTTSTETEYLTALFQKLAKSGIFNSTVSSIAGESLPSTISTYMENSTVNVSQLAGDYDAFFGNIGADTISTVLLQAETGMFNQVITKYLQADTIVTKLIESEVGNFGTLTAKLLEANTGKFQELFSTYLQSSTIQVTQLVGERGDFDEIFANTLEANNATIHSIVANYIQTNKIDVDYITGTSAQFQQLISDNITSQMIVTNILNASEAQIEALQAKIVSAEAITADTIKAALAEVDTLAADSAFARYLQSVSSTTVNSVVDQEYVKNLVANYITVADLAASDITLTDAMKIVSENGKLVMNGQALQITGEDGSGNEYVAIQLGYDTTGTPSLIIRDDEGTALFTSQGYTQEGVTIGKGITSDAIADQLIVNNMIHDGTISEDKLNFSVMKTGDSVTIQQIYTDAGTQFGTEWTNYKNTVNVLNTDTITSILMYFYSSTSSTTPTGGSWTTDPSELDYGNGKYIWQKSVTTYSDTSTEESDPVMITGNTGLTGPQGIQGIPGTNGTNGKTSYFHVMYSSVANPTSSSQITKTPSTYIGTYVDFTQDDSTSPSKYTWSRFEGLQGEKGDQGIPGNDGSDGIDGTTYYLHIKYSNDGGVTFTANSGETVGEYMGTLVNTTQADSTNVSDYTWAKIKGEQGIPGINGTNGKTSYFHIMYSSVENPTSSSQMTKTPSTYIGTYVDFTQADSTSPGDYTWSRFEGEKGEQGIPGTNGEDGETQYLHIKYSDDGGTTFTDNTGETVGDYIGTLVDLNSSDSTTPSDYTWARLKGYDGLGIVSIAPMYLSSNTDQRSLIPDPPADGNTGIAVSEGRLKTTDGGMLLYIDGWKSDAPEWEYGLFVWTCNCITYSDGTVEYTEPYCDTAWLAANEVQENLEEVEATLSSTISGVKQIADDNNLQITNKVWQTDIDGTVKNLNIGGKNLYEYDEFYSYQDGALNDATNITKNKELYNVTGDPSDLVGFSVDASDLQVTSGAREIIIDGYFSRSDSSSSAYAGVVLKYQCYDMYNNKIGTEQSQSLTFNLNDDGVPISTRFATIIDIPDNTYYVNVGIGQPYSQPYVVSHISIKDASLFDMTRDIRDRIVEQNIDIDGIHSSVVDIQTTIGDEDTEGSLMKRMATQELTASGLQTTVTQISTDLGNTTTTANQTASKFQWLVQSGTSSSDMVLTDNLLSVIAQNIDLTGLVTFNSFDSTTKTSIQQATTWVDTNKTNYDNIVDMLTNWAYGDALNASTSINGGLIQTHTVVADALSVNQLSAITGNVGTLTAGVLQSTNYEYTEGMYNDEGVYLDLTNGLFRSTEFALNPDGNSYFKGNVLAKSFFLGISDYSALATLNGRWILGDGAMYVNVADENYILFDGEKLVIKTDGLVINEEGCSFEGTVYATDGEFNGAIKSITGYIGPWNINDTSIWMGSSVIGTEGVTNMYLGKNGISLSNKFVYDAYNGTLEVLADSFLIKSPTTSEYKDINEVISDVEEESAEALSTFITNTYTPKISEIQGQTDAKAETWKSTSDPSTNWTDKLAHEGDIWYNLNDNICYMWSGTQWDVMSTNPPQAVFDDIDGRAVIFVNTPTPPYNIGDLWVNASYTDSDNVEHSNEILRCQHSRHSGQSYALSDWVLASDYSDDSALEDFLSTKYAAIVEKVEEQEDKKIESYWQSTDPSTEWTTEEGETETEMKARHGGDIWYDTANEQYLRWNNTAWQEMKANPPQAVFDTIDGKSSIFVSQPTPPYYRGDMWCNATVTIGDEDYTDELLRCNVTRTSGSFVATDWVKSSKYTDDSALTSFINGSYATTIESLQEQDDLKAETWYQASDPATTESWTSTDKAKHVGDIWYDTTNSLYKIYKVSGSTYSWEEMKVNPPDDVIDTIDGKSSIYVSQPTPPYYVGDLWVNATISGTYSNDILKCKTTRISGSFNSSDWAKASSYTDDTAADAAQSTADSALSAATDAAKTATQYLSFTTTNGLVIYQDTSSTSSYNTQIVSTGVNIRNGTTSYASFGSNIIFYKPGTTSEGIKINSTGVYIYNPNNNKVAVTVDSNGLSINKLNTTTVATRVTSDGLEIYSGSININDRFVVDTNGALTLTSELSSASNYTTLEMDSDALSIKRKKYSDSSILQSVSLGSSGISIQSNNSAAYTTVIYKNTNYYGCLFSDSGGFGVYCNSSSRPLIYEAWTNNKIYIGASYNSSATSAINLMGSTYISSSLDVNGAISGTSVSSDSYVQVNNGSYSGRLVSNGNGVSLYSSFANRYIVGMRGTSPYPVFIGGLLDMSSSPYSSSGSTAPLYILDDIYCTKRPSRLFMRNPNNTVNRCVLTLNTNNYLHIGAQNLSDCANGACADRIYLDATNVYYGPSGTAITTSDSRLKHNIEDITGAKDFIMSIEPKKFKFNAGTSDRYHTGFIAQQVRDAMNDTIGDTGIFCEVDMTDEGMSADEDNVICMLRYDEIIAPHVAVTQEHEKRIQELEDEIKLLKEQLSLLLGGQGNNE